MRAILLLTCSQITNSAAAAFASGMLRVSNTTSGASAGIVVVAVGEVGVGAVADVVVQAHREVAQALGDPDRPLAALLVVAALELLLQQQLARFLAGQGAARIHLGDGEPEQVRLEV